MTGEINFGAVQCSCCGVGMWGAIGSTTPLCNGCKEARQPLLAEIERLKADLAKFHECNDGDCMPEYAHEGWTIWHKVNDVGDDE